MKKIILVFVLVISTGCVIVSPGHIRGSKIYNNYNRPSYTRPHYQPQVYPNAQHTLRGNRQPLHRK